MHRIKNFSWYIYAGLFLYGIVLYSNTFQNSFHFDDFVFIVQNPELSNIFDINSIWNEGSAPTRFITYLTFALNYHIHGYQLFGYHLTNILIHIINTGLVYWLVSLLINALVHRRLFNENKKQTTAVIAAVLFLTHPIQTQAVTYLCQRFASLATLFYLLAVCLYLKARLMDSQTKVWFYCSAFCAGIMGMFTKQIVLTLPITIVLVEGLFLNRRRNERFSFKFLWVFIAAMLVLFLTIPVVYSFNVQTILFREYNSLSHEGNSLNFMSYFLTQSRVIWTYIRLLFLPIGQNLLYDYPASYALSEPKVLLGFSGIGLFLYLAIRCWKTKPLVSFGILWFFTTLLVESSVIPIRHVIFEHRCYLPFFGFSLVAGAFFTEIIKDRYKLAAAILVVIMTLSVLTYKRNEIWANDITLWTDVIKKSPRVIRPYTHLATAYLNQKDFDSALNVYTKAIVLDPEQAESYNNRGNVYTVLNQHDLALKDYLTALSIDPTLEKTYNNIGIIYNKRKDFSQALAYYGKALELNSENAGVYYNRANVYLQLDQLDKAFEDYSRSIKLNPFQKKAFYYRSQIYASEERFTDALADIERAQTLGLKVDQTYINQLRTKISR